ncbi:MAG: glycerol-3-phosphate 1-O-acyltransferase PlsY [Lentisphaerae bacterium]|nr:glycerol-3-phosphate 1-O-acyltransferase PlsY [Lentisphaerota bacterium]
MTTLLLCAASYLLGAVPFGYLVGRARGMDVRLAGSGNVGATNVWRTAGRTAGLVTLLADAAKGFIPACGFPMLAAARGAGDTTALGVLCACLAVAGHNWPVYLRFKGGKGVATTMGALLGIAPAALGVMALVWLVLFAATRYVSVGSIGGALALSAAGWLLYFRERGWILPAALTALGLAAVWRHRGNIRRLLKGTERRMGKKARGEGAAG